MSEPSIPAPEDEDKPAIIMDTNLLFQHYRVFITTAAAADLPKPRRRRPPGPRRLRPRPKQITPYQAKRAAMEDLPLKRLRRYGFTPYVGEERRFLMTPPEFDLVLACEPRQVAQVIFEVLKQSVGYPGDSADGRRAWVALSFRHFERRGLMGRHGAQDALNEAVAKGYLLRRQHGKQRWEYAVHYRQVDNVPHEVNS